MRRSTTASITSRRIASRLSCQDCSTRCTTTLVPASRLLLGQLGHATWLRRFASEKSKVLAPVIDVIANSPRETWEIDANLYGDGPCRTRFSHGSSNCGGVARRGVGHSGHKDHVGDLRLCASASIIVVPFKKGFGVSKFGSGRRLSMRKSRGVLQREHRRSSDTEFGRWNSLPVKKRNEGTLARR